MPRLNRGPARAKQTQAPIYSIAQREITAVEHPMVVQNLDNGLKTFGTNKPYERMMNSIDPEECIPLYLRHNDPMCVPILSHNSPTNNVLLKITVPKRTGRKRKRGSQGPYEYGDSRDHSSAPTAPAVISDAVPAPSDLEASSPTSDAADLDPAVSMPPPEVVNSVSRMDAPASILRKMKDNVNDYKVEAVGEIRQSHRFRGMSDFHQSSSNTEFIPKFKNTVLTGRIEDIRKFALDKGRGWKSNEDIVPPPIMSSHALPFNWGWHQATHLTQQEDEEGNRILVNHSKPEKGGVQYLSHDVEDVPTEPERDMPTDEPTLELIALLRDAMKERPIWTRRSLLNRVGNVPGIYAFKQAIPFVGYQFKGGPWRDSLIKFGVDPRTHSKYRQYQTFFFQFNDEAEKMEGEPWRDSRPNFNISKEHGITHTKDDTHVFDGKKLTLDGKIWQVCDITVPLLVNLMENAPYRDKCEILTDGWYCNGTIAKFKSIMKTKLIAVKARREVADKDFETALAIPDIVPDKLSKNIPVPVPDLRLSQKVLDEMTTEGTLNKSEAATIQRWLRNKKSYKARSERIRDVVGGVKVTRKGGLLPKKVRDGPKRKYVRKAVKNAGEGSTAAGTDAEKDSADPSAAVDGNSREASTPAPSDAAHLPLLAPRPSTGIPVTTVPPNQTVGPVRGFFSNAQVLPKLAPSNPTTHTNPSSPMSDALPHLTSPAPSTPRLNHHPVLGTFASPSPGPSPNVGMMPSSPFDEYDDVDDDDDEGMTTEEERDALASDQDDDVDMDTEDYFSDAVEHQKMRSAGEQREEDDEEDEEGEDEG